MIRAREVIGRADASWGRMDRACRSLCAAVLLLGEIPREAALILVTRVGCAETDRDFERARLAGEIDPQRFAYTLPTTPIGEASIRAGITGPGFAILGASEQQVSTCIAGLITEGIDDVIVGHVDCDAPPHQARAEWWRASRD